MRILTLAGSTLLTASLLLCGTLCAEESALELRATKGTATSYGAAVAVQHAGKTRLLTCWHLLAGKDKYLVRHGDKWHAVKLLAKDADLDIAELSTVAGLKGAELDTREIVTKTHEDVVLLSSVHRGTGTLSRHKANTVPGRQGVQRAAHVEGTGEHDWRKTGYSGGALMRGKRIIGMLMGARMDHVAKTKHGLDVRFARCSCWYVPASRLRQFMDTNEREVASGKVRKQDK